jgi:hypothetical protein
MRRDGIPEGFFGTPPMFILLGLRSTEILRANDNMGTSVLGQPLQKEFLKTWKYSK